MEDKDLIKRAQEGSKEAFGDLYKKYFQKVYRYCRFNTVHDELAKDICQESFLKAYKKLKDFKTDGVWSFQSYLFTIARNLIIDASRKKRDINIDEFENLESNENLYENVEKKEIIKKVRLSISKLDEIERQIVLLRFFEELPSLEVAKILNMTGGALRVRTHRIMQKLKDIFEILYEKRN